ncbi:hypothetical protein ACFQGX_50055 [Nonomuraea dietziae]|uniref:hypothetical protein n=1 Tax=Nonomuraea dietziae TaxID=65515 RepID=UPI0036107608
MDANAWAAIAAAVVATIALYFAAVSARAAKRAAAHAEVVAKVEEDRREEERDRRHEELAPLPLGRVATKETRNGLYASLHVPRVYLVRIGLSTSANPASDDDYTWQKQRFLSIMSQTISASTGSGPCPPDSPALLPSRSNIGVPTFSTWWGTTTCHRSGMSSLRRYPFPVGGSAPPTLSTPILSNPTS